MMMMMLIDAVSITGLDGIVQILKTDTVTVTVVFKVKGGQRSRSCTQMAGNVKKGD